ncbi:SDR family oxidoreductase [Pseudolysinimonas sp.]|jgi:nucleoside-diphosphate-sugar epimerase|uniref:SDR family oxidoreductase n=1 Tax=Pseudolysinimonas sp. TaxID=2680009 RepID=UPI00378361E4
MATARRILFLGGNGTISASVSREVLARGAELTHLTRGIGSTRAPIDGVRHLTGDAADPASIRSALGDEEFDVVVNFRAFLPTQVSADIETFGGRTGQYVFISSASAYQKPVAALPIVESTPLRNPYWKYSRDKIACEDLLVAAYRDSGFPMTIVRPSHTYDGGSIPLDGGWTALDRMRRGVPVVIHGDGTSLWTLTHSRDFARAFVGLLGNPHALGSAIHITGDEVLTWDAIAGMLGGALGVTPELVHVASETIARVLPDAGPGLLGDKAHSVVFDNTRVKTLVPGWTATIPFADGAREIVDWHLADPRRQSIQTELNEGFDRLVAIANGGRG